MLTVCRMRSLFTALLYYVRSSCFAFIVLDYTNVASVTINGQTSTRVLRQRDMVVEAYKRDGFKYQWLNNNTILLTKRKRKAA